MKLTRRSFLKATLAAGGVFVVGVSCSSCSNGRKIMRDEAARTGTFMPNALVAVMPNGMVTIAVAKAEMGQGVFTSHAMLVAEELELPLERVHAYHPDAGPDYQVFGMQITGGSSSLPESYVPIREAAAAAREMLLMAAASTWSCPISECSALEGQIVHASGKKLAYGELTVLASQQDIPSSPKIKSRSEFKLIGKDKVRVDALDKVIGKSVYGMDVAVPGMLRAVVLRAPVMGSTLKSFEGSQARIMPGVVDVFEFERGVAVVAEKYWQAQRAANLVTVEWNDDSNLRRFNTTDLRDACRESVKRPGSKMKNEGDTGEALSQTALKQIEATYESPYLAHAPMEPMNAAAHVREGEVEIWAPVQWQSAVQGDVAWLLDIPREKVILHTLMLGGGFGRRLMIDYVIEAVLISKRLKKPVHVIWSREDDTKGGYYRPFNHTRIRGAIDSEGRPVALEYHTLSQSLLDLRDWLPSILPQWMPRLTRTMAARAAGNLVDSNTVPNILATEGANDIPYAIPNIRVEYTPIRVDVPVSFWRSVGHSFNAFAVESFIDELAHAADRDELEFRRELLEGHARHLGVLNRVAEMSNWGAKMPPGRGMGIAVHKSFNTYCAEVVEAEVRGKDILVHRVWCAVDCGVVVNPDIVRQQMESCIVQGISAAIYQEIQFIDGQVIEGNFDDYKFIRMSESPEMFINIVESSEDPTGVGEPGLPPIAPALAGAIFRSTGKRLRSMPFLKALSEQEGDVP